MPRQNPYMMDPLLAQGFSNLTKALIGDPETDYQVARTGYQNEQTNRLKTLLPHEEASLIAQAAQRNAAAGASTKQGGYFESQTAGQNLKNDQLSSFAEAMNILSTSPEAQAAVALATGIGLSDINNPEASAINSALVRSMFGTGGDASQTSAALTGLGESVRGADAFGQIMDPNSTPDQIRQAAIASGLNPGQFFEAGSSEALARIGAKADTDVAQINSEAQKIWEAYSADRKKEADVTVQELKNTQSGVEAANRLAAEIQWESENNVIVEDGRMVFSPEAAKKYGVTNTVNLGSAEKPQEMYIIDVSPENKNGIPVTIEGTDKEIFLDQQYFDKFNVQNRNGKFVIPQGSVTGASKGASPTSRNTNATQHLTEEMYADLTGFLKERIPASLGDLPNNVQVGTEAFIINQVNNFIGKNPNTPYMDAYNKVGAPIVSGGLVELGNNNPFRSNIKVPRFFDEKWKANAAKVGKPIQRNGSENYTREMLLNAIEKNATSLGYTPSDISKILESY